MTRQVFFEYGRATSDVWRLRSEAIVPRTVTFEKDSRVLRADPGGPASYILPRAPPHN